jgi:prepilin-type processing-associated H-X9-DG protein
LKNVSENFALPKGFYSCIHIFILLATMALTRIKTPEQLRYHPAGEGGKLLGLDRIPEVRTLREKIKLLAQPDRVKEWGGELSREWMNADPEAAGILYVDGHVRVYHGSQTKLPRRYVARQRLCLRGLTDYWVNDQEGRPFFVVSTPFTTGLLDMLKREIVPILLQEVPHQPAEKELQATPHLHRFTLVFDREGYSPEFFAHMWNSRIACQTYNKFPRENWPVSEFQTVDVRMPGGHETPMRLAERGRFLGGKIWLREIRKLGDTGHQTSVISTDYTSDLPQIAAHMFTRWCQENFFRYMMEHYHLDGLIDYETVLPDETMKVVNPAYRKLESQIKSVAAKKVRKQAEFGALALQEPSNAKEIERYEIQKGTILEEMDRMEKQLDDFKKQRNQTKKHIAFGDLPKEEKFRQLAPTKKQFMDTIRMIAYRAETAMVSVLREVLSRGDDARSLAREIMTTEADIIPDEEKGTLTIRLHHLTNRLSDHAARHLAAHLNETETIYPGTNLRLVYNLVSDQYLPDQEV